MQVARLLGLFAIIGAAVGEVCHNCSKDRPLAVNLSILGEPNKIIDTDAAGAAPPPPPPPPPVPKRIEPAGNALWDQCKRKGCTLAWAMRKNDQEVGPYYNPQRNTAASPYQNEEDFTRWGWLDYPRGRINEEFDDFYGVWGIGWALADLGVNDLSDAYEGGENVIMSVGHEIPPPPPEDLKEDEDMDDRNPDFQTYEVDGKEYRRTGASYSFSINAIDGVIIGLNRKSPRNAAAEKNPPVPNDGLLELSQFSDVAWIKWKERVRVEKEAKRESIITGLKYFFSVSIENRETISVLLRALHTTSTGITDWPGVTFEDGSDEIKAIIGTPNIQGLAYFLVQHKADLGNMYISKVQVFQSETGAPCILAHISQPNDQTGEVEKREGRKHMAWTHAIRANL